MASKATLISGIRSTGELHLGNYYGALGGMLEAQEQYEAAFFIADLHALTTHPNPDAMERRVLDIAKDYLAAGLDPHKSTFYVQSSLAAEVAELHLYLSMVMPLGELLRCPTFKEKAQKHPDNVNYGLVGYPVLMAADILLNRADRVKVGEDQLVHLELARTIQRRFNQLYGPTFSAPQALVQHAVRIPALSGQGKMSKSDAADTYIGMIDDRDTIDRKVRKAYSDPTRTVRELPGHPTAEGCNVFHLHSYFTGNDVTRSIEIQCSQAEIGCVQCKRHLADSIAAIVVPFQERRARLSDEETRERLKLGQAKARTAAQGVLAQVRNAMGLRVI